MDQGKLSSLRTVAKCSAIFRSRHVEADLCKIDSDHFTAMYNQIFDELILKEFKNMQDKVDRASWIINPDRSGGQFTQDEINRDTWS